MMHTIGTIHRRLGQDEEATDLLEKAPEVREELLEPESLAVAESLDALAALHLDAGQYAEARSRAERALAIRGSFLGPEHPEVAESLARLGWALAWILSSLVEIADMDALMAWAESEDGEKAKAEDGVGCQ